VAIYIYIYIYAADLRRNESDGLI